MDRVADVRFDDHGVDSATAFRRLAARRWWVVWSVVLCTSASAAVAFLSTPVYRSITVIAPASENRASSLGAALGSLGGIASLAGLNLGQSQQTQEALAVLQSSELSEAFIKDKGLITKFFAKKWNPATQTWNVPQEKIPTPNKAFRYFDRKVRTVSTDKKSGLIELQIDWTDRNEAADWANDLVRRLNEEMRDRAVSRADEAMVYLEKELATTSTVETRAAIGRVMEAQVKERMLARVTEDYAFRVVDRATPADRDDPVRPQKALLIIIGFLMGGALGSSLAILAGEPAAAKSKAVRE